MKNKFLIVVFAGFTLAVSSLANAGLIEVNPSADSGSCCSSSERGYFFTTPEALTFTSFWLNTASGLSTDYNLDVLLINDVPPEYSSSTTDYVTLGTWDGLTGIFNTNITVAEGSVIGLLAWDNSLSSTPYGTAFNQDINGETVSFTRLIRQSLTNGNPISTESSVSKIGAIGFQANSAQVPNHLHLLFLY